MSPNYPEDQLLTSSTAFQAAAEDLKIIGLTCLFLQSWGGRERACVTAQVKTIDVSVSECVRARGTLPVHSDPPCNKSNSPPPVLFV